MRDRRVWARGRLGRFLGGLVDHTRTAWWGLFSSHLAEREELVITQAVILSGGDPRRVLLSISQRSLRMELPGGTPEPGESLRVDAAPGGAGGDGARGRDRGRGRPAGSERASVPYGACLPLPGRGRSAHALARDTPRRLARRPASTARALRLVPGALALALEPSAEPVERTEWQGLDAIWDALKIDIAMRWKGLPPQLLPRTKDPLRPSKEAVDRDDRIRLLRSSGPVACVAHGMWRACGRTTRHEVQPPLRRSKR